MSIIIVSTRQWGVLRVNGIDNLSFFQHLITSFKVKTAIKEIEKSLENGESVVVGLQTTGETSLKRTNVNSCLYDLFVRHNGNVESTDFSINPIDIFIQRFGKDTIS